MKANWIRWTQIKWKILFVHFAYFVHFAKYVFKNPTLTVVAVMWTPLLMDPTPSQLDFYIMQSINCYREIFESIHCKLCLLMKLEMLG